MANDLRIGLQEGLVEEAIAAAFELPLATVKRVHMLTGDLGETAVRAHAGETAAASIELFKPIRFMLAAAVADATEAMERVGGKAWTEEKYDGVRCQLHRTRTRVALYSRDLRETTAAFPEVAEAAERIDHELLIDGEILAHRDGKVLRFFGASAAARPQGRRQQAAGGGPCRPGRLRPPPPRRRAAPRPAAAGTAKAARRAAPGAPLPARSLRDGDRRGGARPDLRRDP